ncbi:GNAT family N-acetyltransferase [Pseudomonas sp. NPDC007930]|uniref:GNAT family N-acetyltransferase n=1 Tax=Pseudomonas sp. NPDC007930 TaxID=3364417 RepID=UPI0036EB1FF8
MIFTLPMTHPRLICRPPLASDAPRLFNIYSDPRTQQFNPAGPMASRREADALLASWLEHWQRLGYGWWAVALAAAPDELIGFGGVAYHDYLDEARLNLGYRFAPEAWGQGYATELGQLALRSAFATPGIERVWALVRPGHAASIRVLEKLGLRRCGSLDDVPGQPQSLVYAIDKGERP